MLSPTQKQSRNSSATRGKTKTHIRAVALRPLSIEELTQVSLATFRESFNHRRWPRDVVEKLLTVEV